MDFSKMFALGLGEQAQKYESVFSRPAEGEYVARSGVYSQTTAPSTNLMEVVRQLGNFPSQDAKPNEG